VSSQKGVDIFTRHALSLGLPQPHGLLSSCTYIIPRIVGQCQVFYSLYFVSYYFNRKDECHGGGSLLFSFPRLPSWGQHFHEQGGIHLILPSSFTYIIPRFVGHCQVYSSFRVYFIVLNRCLGLVSTETTI